MEERIGRKERERCAKGLAVRSFPAVSRPSFFREHQEHCKVITVSFAIGPVVKHYGHKSLTGSTQHNGNQSKTFYSPPPFFLPAFHQPMCKQKKKVCLLFKLNIVD